MRTKQLVGTMVRKLVWIVCCSLNAPAFGGEALVQVRDLDVASGSIFPQPVHPHPGIAVLVSTPDVPAIKSIWLVTLSADELDSIVGRGAMPAAPGTPTTGVVLWDERPRPPAVVGTTLSQGQQNYQTSGVTILGP